MHNLIRYYNKNRFKVWIAIFIIIFILILIQVLNSFAKQRRIEKQNNIEKETTSNVVSYNNESKTIMSGDEVSDEYKNDFGQLIDEFFTHCINHEPQKAYDLLSNNIKNLKYKTEELFEELYYKERFEGNKKYSFQSWSKSNDIYIYQVKIFEDMLSTGKNSEESYQEDFVTIVPEGGDFKLNIDKYIGRKEIFKKASNDILQISAQIVDIYMYSEIYTLNVKNNTDETILLDTRKKTNTTYLVDNLDNKFYSLLYENKESDLIIEPNEMKTIKIKFNDAYRENIEIKEINFENIVNYEEYKQNNDVEDNTLKIEI